VNITTSVNTTTQTVCGSTTSFSPFALFEPSSPLPQTVTASLGTPQQAAVDAAFSTQFEATVTDTNGNAMPGIPVTFAAPLGGATGIFTGIGAFATVTTDSNGIATAPAFTADGFVGNYMVTASVNGVPTAANFAMANVSASATISWIPASPITYGTPLGAAQLDAMDSVPGNFAYNPPAGTTLAAGLQTLSATFSPTDTTDYTTATADAALLVDPAPLTITASSGSMVFGGPVFPVIPGYNGFANGDVPASLTPAPSCGTAATSVSPVGSYVSNCSGASDPNYTIGYVSGTVSVTPATTTTTVLSSENPSGYMQLVTLTATVTPQYSPTVPTGTVTFYNNGTSIGTAALSVVSCGAPPCLAQASFSTASLPDSGPDSITAVYSGDGNFLSSTSQPTAQTVQPAPIVNFNPMFLSFGNQNANTASLPAPVTLTNIGDAPLDLSSHPISINGANAGEFAQDSNCGSTLAAGSSCTINVVFTPVDTGAAAAALQIKDNDEGTSGAQQSVSLAGSGLSTIVHRSLFGYGIFATAMDCNSIMMSGGSTVDSFDSSLGFNASHELSGGNVGTNGNVTLRGNNTVIYGTAATGSCGSTWSGEGQVSGGLLGLGGPMIYPAIPPPGAFTVNQSVAGSCGSLSGCTSLGTNAVNLAPGQYGNLTISGGTTAHLSAGTYNLNSLTLNGNSSLFVDAGPALINLAGVSLFGINPAMDLSGGSIDNPSGVPANLQFTYGGSAVINLSGGPASYATVYAPNAVVNLSRGSDFFGAIVGCIVTNTAGLRFHYDRNLPNILAGNYIWFSAVVNNVAGLPYGPQVNLYLSDSTITFTAGGISYSLPVPNGAITFNSMSVKVPATTYNLANNTWNTQVPASGLTGNTFVTGLAFPVPANFPSGIQNVQWSAAFTTDTPGVKLQWQWSAAVYKSFSTVYASGGNNNILGVNAESGLADTNGGEPAGTPETNKASLIFGATGPGWTNFTGFPSPGAFVIPSAAPVSVSPSVLDFGTQAQGTTSAPLTATLTNNDRSAYNIASVTVTGTDAGDFTTSGCPPTLASGASCTLTVTFAPGDAGARTATIVINDNAKNAPQTIYLTGAGQ
jgi:Bacterial Ig-like domain (group 3)/MBG domain (YGX type)